MTDIDDTPRVTRNDDESRYELHLGDVLAGFSRWVTDSRGRTQLVHTEVDPAFAGRGLATTLISQTLADLAGREETIVPRCPFVAKYLGDNTVDGLDVAWPQTAPGA